MKSIIRQHILDTSTSSDDSGVFSSASTSPGQSPSPVGEASGIPVAEHQMPSLEETPGTPAPEQVECQTPGQGTTAPEHQVAGLMETPGTTVQEVTCHTQDLGTTEVPPGSGTTLPQHTQHQMAGPKETPATQQTSYQTPGQNQSTRVFSPEVLRQKVVDACPYLCCDSLFISSCQVALKTTGIPAIYFSNRSWSLNYPVLSFMMNGQLYAEYERVTGMLGSYNSLSVCSYVPL